MTDHGIAGLGRARIAAFREREAARYAIGRPKSRAAAQSAGDWLDAVPMHWMKDWPLPFAMVVAQARGPA